MGKFTDTMVGNLKAKASRYEKFEGGSGLSIRVNRDATKTFRFWFSKDGSRARPMTLGRYRPAHQASAPGAASHDGDGKPFLTLADASAAAAAAKKLLEAGIDPATRAAALKAEKREAKGNTLSAIVSDGFPNDPAFVPFLAQHYAGKSSEGEMKRIWSTGILPALGQKSVSEIRRGDITTLLDKIEADARNPERGWNGVTSRNAALRRLQTFFRWALERELVEADPTAGIKKRDGEGESEKRVFEDHELRWLVLAAEELPAPIGPYLKLLLLTGQRRKATATLRSAMLDSDERVWKLPPAHYKTRSYCEIPFSPAAWSVVQDLVSKAEEAKRDHLFVSVIKSHGDKPVQNFSGIKEEIDAKVAEIQKRFADAGEKVKPLGSWSLHDLRHTMRTVMPKLKVAEHVAELCLGHSKKGIEAVYNHHSYRDEKRQAFTTWADHLSKVSRHLRAVA